MHNLKINSLAEYKEKYKKSIEQPEAFWGEISESFLWKRKYDSVLKWNFREPKIQWFEGATLNITENMLDRHVQQNPNKKALIWEPNEPNEKSVEFTYKELLQEVCKCANALKDLGVGKGDRVCIYMPMIPQLAISVMACARIGAVHSVVFAGFSATALADRINDAEAKLLITADGLNRGTKQITLKTLVDEALEKTSTIEKVLVCAHTNENIEMQADRDVWWHEAVDNSEDFCEAEEMDSEDLLFILYTSGSTGKPKGVVHTCGGYMVYTAYTFQNVYQYEPEDVFWCTADIGWITGHSYLVYGPLLCGATSVMFEGIPTYPDAGRFWEIIEKYKVSQFLTAPTAIRSLMAFDESFVTDKNLNSLKIIGTVGEPINEEAWQWYHKYVGQEKCPVVDNWWQTETGGIMISGLGNLSPQKPTYAGFPLPGIQPVLLNQEGKEIKESDQEGYLCIKAPWPGMLRSIYKDHERCRITYFSHYEGYYFTGDGAKRDSEGMYRIIGRIDDVINVSGHRFGTAEIENAINQSDFVIESAVVAYPHPLKGQSIYAFVVLDEGFIAGENIKEDIKQSVTNGIGKIALPEKIQFVAELPKTRSGKIMRRILRKIAEGETSNFGDTSTLLDPAVVEDLLANRV